MKSSPPAAVNAKAPLFARQRQVSSFLLAGVCVCLLLFNCVSSPPAEKNAADTITTTYTQLLPPCGRLRMPNSLEYSVPVFVNKKKARSLSVALQNPPPSWPPPSLASFSLSSSSTLLSSSVSPESASCTHPPFLCITSLGLFSFASLSPFLWTLSSGVRTLHQGTLHVLRLLLFFSGSLDCFLPPGWQPLRLSFLPSASFSPLTAASHHPQTANSNFLLQQQLPHTLAAASAAAPSVPSVPTRSKSTHHKGSSEKTSSSSLYEGDTAESGGEKSNYVSSSEQRGLSAEALKQFYSSFPDPPPPPTGVIELDIATWDLIVDVVTSPQQSRGEGPPPVQEQRRRPLNTQTQQQQQQRQQQQGEELLQGLHAGAGEDVFVKLEHSAVPTPPRLWLVAFMASGCMHCQRLRPVLQQLQRLYTSKLRRLRAARRHALAHLQQEATAALSVAAATTARAQHDLLQLAGGKTPEAAVKIAEQHAVMMQQEEQTLQQKLLQQVSQLYSAAATATWAYPDTVFVAFDCMQDREHQHLCRDVLGISKFPEVLLLRKLPSLPSLTARAAEHPPLPVSVPCPSSLPPQATPLSPAAPAAAGVPSPTAADASYDRAAAAEGASASAARAEKEKEEVSFSASPLLRERLMQQRSVGLRPWAAGGSTKKDRGRTALLCALQEELLAEFPPFTIPSLQQLLLFLYSSTAETASWAPVVPPPVAFLQWVLLHSVTASSAVAADAAVGPAAGVDADAAAEGRGRRASAAREKAAAVAASAAATFLEKEQRYRNSNTFPTWLAKRMRGEAVRQVFSREEIRLLHYGTAGAASSSSGSCSSPAVSFLVCVNLSRTLQTERGEPARSPLLVHQVQQRRYSQHQQHSPQQQQQEYQQQQRQIEERLRRIATVVAGEVVRLDGLRDAFETYAAAAAELRRQHLFLYSLNPAACAPQGLQSEGSSISAAERLLLKMRQHHAAADTAAVAGRADRGPRAAVDGEMDSTSSHWDQQQQYPLRVVALQPTLLVQGTEEISGEDKQRTCGDQEEEEEPDAAGGAAYISSSSNREERAQQEQYEEQDGEEKGSSSAREQYKVLLLQRVLEGIWAAQRTVALELQQREEEGGDGGEKTRRAAGDFVDEDAEKTEYRCVLEGGGNASQGRCVDPREDQPQVQRQMYQQQQQQPQERGGSCVLEENERVNAMQLPTFVGPFPPRLDQLKTSASARQSAAAAASFLYAAVSSPPLASFLDVFRIPTLSLVGDKNFMQLRVSSSRSWLPTAGSSSSEGSLAMGSRQLVVAVLDLRVLDTLLAMFTKSQIAAAVEQAVQQQQQAAVLTLTAGAAADEGAAARPVNTEGGGDTRPREEEKPAGRTEGVKSRLQAAGGMQTDSSKGRSSNGKRGSGGWLWGVFSSMWSLSFFAADSGRTAAGSSEVDHLAAAPAYSTSESVSTAAPLTRVDIIAATLSGVTLSGSISSDAAATAAASESSQGRAATTAAASQLIKLVEELWQLSWTARKVLLQSRVDLFKQLLDSDSSHNNWYTTDCRSRLPLFTSPFLFGILDGFTYSEALADYDIHANEEGELPAVLAFDSVLPAGGRRSSPPSSSSGSACRSSSSLSETGDTESRRTAHERSREGVESCRSPGSTCGVGDFTGQCSGGGETATQSVEWRTKKGRVVPYYYRDRLRLRLDDLPRGLYLLRRQAIEGRRLAEEEEDDEDDESESVVTGNVFQLFWRAIESFGTWRAVFRKASRSRFGMFRLIVSLIAFFLVLACSAILMFYSVCCPSRDSADDGGEEYEAEADTDADDSVGTADTDTEDETNDEEVQEGGKKLEAGKENSNTFTTTLDRERIRQKTDAGKGGENKHEMTLEGGSSSDNSASNNPTKRNDQTEVLSIEEVHRRAEEMLRSTS